MIKFTAARLLGLLTLTIAGCSMTHGDPKNPKQNPHPLQRYEVIATTEAPGPWDAVSGYISYEVVNAACTPEDKFLGVHVRPQDVGHEIEMFRVNEKTWRGYFFRDLIQDEDYYGLGVCHWNATQVAPIFTVHEVTFGSAQRIDKALTGPQTDYFSKGDFDKSKNGDPLLLRYGASSYSAARPEYRKDPGAFFPISVIVKEARP